MQNESGRALQNKSYTFQSNRTLPKFKRVNAMYFDPLNQSGFLCIMLELVRSSKQESCFFSCTIILASVSWPRQFFITPQLLQSALFRKSSSVSLGRGGTCAVYVFGKH